MNTSTLAIIISGFALLNAALLGWSGRNRTARKDTVEDAGKDTELRVNVEHIKRGVDDMRFELRAQGQRHDALAERVTRVEESSKQAHHRIDEIKKGDTR